MPDYSSVSFPPPSDWQAFERASRVLFSCLLQDPDAQTNGTSGQRQHGVDIYGNRGGGPGPLVGIQCKGKDGNFGKKVTETELRNEVKNTEEFKPPLKEFFLITTAKDDAVIQEKARLLEESVRANGRDLSITVLGWGQLQERIREYAEAIRAFHPDAFPLSGPLLDETQQIKALVDDTHTKQTEHHEAVMEALRGITAKLTPQISFNDSVVVEEFDKHLHEQINSYRAFIQRGQPATALQLFQELKEKILTKSSSRIQFRILSNIAAALHSLHRFDEAAPLFIAAFDLNPDDPVAKANKIAALLIQGHNDQARELAIKSLAEHPDNPDVAFQRLQSLTKDEDLEIVWGRLSEAARNKPELYAYRVAVLRSQGKPEWHDALGELKTKFGEEPVSRVMAAEEILDRYLASDAAGIGAIAGSTPTKEEILAAARVMEERWQEVSSYQSPADSSLAYNAALVHFFLKDYSTAKKLLDSAISRGAVEEDAVRLRIAIALRQGEQLVANELSARLGNDPRSLVLRAELLRRSNPTEAGKLLAAWPSFELRSDQTAAFGLLVDILIAAQDFPEADAQINLFASLQPDDPAHLLARYTFLKANGDATAPEVLDLAASKITPDSDFPTRFLIAEELAGASKYDEAVDLLLGRVSYERDTPSLQLLVLSAANADRRATLSEILAHLPQSLRDVPYYMRAAAALALKMGDIKGAEHHIRRYLKAKPRSLEMHIQLLQILMRAGRGSELEREVQRSAAEFDGEPQVFVQYAQFMDVYGDWPKAHALAYRTWIKNQTDPVVCMRYIGLFLAPRHSQGLEINPLEVALDMAISVEAPPLADIYIIEPDAELRTTAFHLAPEHPIAKELLGKKAGDTVSLPGEAEAKIKWIKPKQLHVLHQLMRNIPKLFPSVEGFERFEVDFDSEEGIRPVADRLQAHHDNIEQAFAAYTSGQLPIALLAKWLGASPIDALQGLIQTRRSVFVCEGRHDERVRAFRAIEEHGKKGCIVDAITLHIIRRQGLVSAVEQVCGPIGIVQATVDEIQDDILRLEEKPNEADLSLMWLNGQVVKNEVTVAQKNERLRFLRDEKTWLESNAEIVPSKGKQDLPAEWRGLIGRFGGDVLDEVIAAQGSGRLLVSEDKMFRSISTVFGASNTWLQPILMKALEDGHLTMNDYGKSVVTFIQSGFEYVSIDARCLMWAMHDRKDLPITEDFALIAGRLGGAKADLPSHYNVVTTFLSSTWQDSSVNSVYKYALAGRLLEEICKGRSIEDLRRLFVSLARFGRDKLADPDFIGYLKSWLRGHFIDLGRK